jgi:hypothetical protein
LILAVKGGLGSTMATADIAAALRIEIEPG